MVEFHRVPRLAERPLEVAVDVGARAPVTRLAAAAVDAGDNARIGREMLGVGKACDVAHLKCDHRAQDDGHAGQRHEPLHRIGDGNQFLQLLFDRDDLHVGMVQVLQEQPGHVSSVRRELIDTFFEGHARRLAEGVAIVFEVEGVLGQGGEDSVLDSCALLGEHHACACDLAEVAHVAWRDPDGRECAVALEAVEAVDVELIGLVDTAHHDLRLAGVHETGFETNEELKAYSVAVVDSIKELVNLNPLYKEGLSLILDRLPMDSTATGVPGSAVSRAARIAPGRCSIRRCRVLPVVILSRSINV